jgi:hypothetical protein
MMQNYPAAHSMDTDWFAVDADGNIGIFVSSEAGAVPKSLQKSIDFEEFISKLPRNDRGIVQFATNGSVIIQDNNLDLLWEDVYLSEQVANDINKIFKDRKEVGTTYNLILKLTSESVIDELLPDVWGQFSGSEVIVYMEQCLTSKMKYLMEAGKILGGCSDICPFENAHFFGLFPFRHDFGAPAPYKRRKAPDNPLIIDMLSPDVQELFNMVHLDRIRFAEVAEVQPIEHTECRTWGSDDWWLDTKRERAEWQEIGTAYDDLIEEEEE